MAHPDRLPVWCQRAESALVAALAATTFVELRFDWWWLVVLFLAFDVSMVGYVHSPRVGAWTYNTVHTYALPAGVGVAAVATESRGLAFLALVWAFHIAVDRGLGYGLKFRDRFTHTHLGEIGGGTDVHTS